VIRRKGSGAKRLVLSAKEDEEDVEIRAGVHPAKLRF
jgi:hypothetical protein